ncbi:hypothetical protein CCMSSC00406_0010234 [Pleurotus cornucopiae]|uniref:Uncharacterized protein n=1 Tax=Pleurotus cornucopiae TaxID=5321 RepID=A0ACB7JBI2_PLECO|nr:hypothetical protein CCMSSC00406_0010234 [Pleurotus cornucopiae]
MTAGFLAVLSEAGSQVSLDEFHDWYNNEHIPLRLNNLPSFLTGARYRASDALTPSWIALYDIDSTSTFSDESYTRLRSNRSPREADLIKRLELLDRRTLVAYLDSGENSEKTTSLRCSNPTPTLITHGLDFDVASGDKGAVEAWWKGHLGIMATTNGWVRSRVFECIDSGKVGARINEGRESQDVPRYFVVHEYTGIATFMNPPYPGLKVVEQREWELYRAYPCIAQGNLS